MELHSLFVDLNYWLRELHNSMLQLQKTGSIDDASLFAIVVLH